MTPQFAVALFEKWLTMGGKHIAKAAKIELRGKNLACWCPLDGPCHADILLKIANSPSKSPKSA